MTNMNIACLNCVIKHLSQAMIINEEETTMGYPDHIYRVIGHLAEASRESVTEYPEFANVVRSHRLALMDDRKHIVPYIPMLKYVDVVLLCLESNLPIPGIPDDVMLDVPEPTVGPFLPPSQMT